MSGRQHKVVRVVRKERAENASLGRDKNGKGDRIREAGLSTYLPSSCFGSHKLGWSGQMSGCRNVEGGPTRARVVRDSTRPLL
jgi:hypothetical protein